MSSDPSRVGDDATSAPHAPSGYQIERAMSVWDQVWADWDRLRAELTTDEELVEDENVLAVALRDASVDDPRDLCAKLIDACIWADRRADEAKAIKDEFRDRQHRYEARVEKFRRLIEQLMAATKVRKQAGRFANASVVAAPPSVLVTDEQLIPGEYFKVERTLRRADLLSDLKVGVVVDGAQLSNGGETLRIARLK